MNSLNLPVSGGLEKSGGMGFDLVLRKWVCIGESKKIGGE